MYELFVDFCIAFIGFCVGGYVYSEKYRKELKKCADQAEKVSVHDIER